MVKAKQKKEWVRHFFIPELNTHAPSVTVVVTEASKGEFSISWAICSPPDNFSRKLGREIAKEKLEQRGYIFYPESDEHHPIDAGLNFLMHYDYAKKDPDVKLLRETLAIFYENHEIIENIKQFRMKIKPKPTSLKAKLFNLSQKLFKF